MVQESFTYNSSKLIKKIFSFVTAVLLMFAQFVSPYSSAVHADSSIQLPEPGSMVNLSESYSPVIAMGINVYPDNPLKFDFIVDQGESNLTGDTFEGESKRLIRYFLASLTIPEDEMWVNLSPYEKDRIIPDDFGKTVMGRDLLALDYMLKQLSSSLMHPDQQLGNRFWERVYSKVYEKFGSVDIPMNTFNKIWIVPEQAVLYEHANGAFIVDSHLKVMLEEDYLALEVNRDSTKHGLGEVTFTDIETMSGVSGEIVREILIPEIEREINQGKTFANLRQIYHSMLLATWYKNTLHETVLSQVYVNQKRTQGVEILDKSENQQIYDRYVQAFKEGVFNFIKEEVDPVTHKVIPRKYFSGGVELNGDQALLSDQDAVRDPVIRERVINVANRLDNSARITFGLNSANQAVDSVSTLNFRFMDQSNVQSDNAILAEVRGFAMEFSLDDSLVLAILVNNLKMESYLEGVLRVVRGQNPQTKLSQDEIRAALTQQGIIKDDYLAIEVIREAIELSEPSQGNPQQPSRYLVSGIDYSSILLGALDTSSFSSQLDILTKTSDLDILPQLISRGYITGVLQQTSRNFAALNYIEKFRVSNFMEREGITRAEAVDRVVQEKLVDERQRVAVRSMDHAASAFVDPFGSLGQVAGFMVGLGESSSYSPSEQSQFLLTAEDVIEFKNVLQKYAFLDPVKPNFDFSRMIDFSRQWQTLIPRVLANMDSIRTAAQVDDSDRRLNEMAVDNLERLVQSIASGIDGQIAFAEGRVDYNRKNINLSDSISNAITQVSKKRGFIDGYISFDVNVDTNFLVLDVNPNWVGLIISNLVNNAHDEIKKQVDAGLRVDFEVGDIQVKIQHDQSLNVLELSVHDNAGGISSSSDLLVERLGRQRIFEYGRTEGKEAGTGTGLAEVYHIAQLMEWNVAVEGQKQFTNNSSYSGAEFTVTIPLQAQTSDQAMLSDKVGGIDLNANMIDLSIQKEAGGFIVPKNIQPILDTNVDGFSPVIINVAPIHNLPLLLGFTENNYIPLISNDIIVSPINSNNNS